MISSAPKSCFKSTHIIKYEENRNTHCVSRTHFARYEYAKWYVCQNAEVFG